MADHFGPSWLTPAPFGHILASFQYYSVTILPLGESPVPLWGVPMGLGVNVRVSWGFLMEICRYAGGSAVIGGDLTLER